MLCSFLRSASPLLLSYVSQFTHLVAVTTLLKYFNCSHACPTCLYQCFAFQYSIRVIFFGCYATDSKYSFQSVRHRYHGFFTRNQSKGIDRRFNLFGIASDTKCDIISDNTIFSNDRLIHHAILSDSGVFHNNRILNNRTFSYNNAGSYNTVMYLSIHFCPVTDNTSFYHRLCGNILWQDLTVGIYIFQNSSYKLNSE